MMIILQITWMRVYVKKVALFLRITLFLQYYYNVTSCFKYCEYLIFLILLINEMKSVHLLICFSIIYSCCSVVILQSTTSITIVSPSDATPLSSTYYNTNQKNAAGTGVQWITSSTATSPTIYRNLFYSTCIGKANLTITAATSFNAYLDGALIGSGNNYSNIYNFSIVIICGNHNLTVIVYTTAQVNQGLTFAIDQDQTNCYNCQSNGYWDENSCKCLCITGACQCHCSKIWMTYPFCGCGCYSKTPPLGPLCPSPRYYSQASCLCLCHYKYCPPGQHFNPTTCACVTIK